MHTTKESSNMQTLQMHPSHYIHFKPVTNGMIKTYKPISSNGEKKDVPRSNTTKRAATCNFYKYFDLTLHTLSSRHKWHDKKIQANKLKWIEKKHPKVKHHKKSSNTLILQMHLTLHTLSARHKWHDKKIRVN